MFCKSSNFEGLWLFFASFAVDVEDSDGDILLLKNAMWEEGLGSIQWVKNFQPPNWAAVRSFGSG